MTHKEILKHLITKVILPKYDFLKSFEIEEFHLTNFLEYDVRFITKKKLPVNDQVMIEKEVQSLFKMAGLDNKVKNKTQSNKVMIWFKTPREKEFYFSYPDLNKTL